MRDVSGLIVFTLSPLLLWRMAAPFTADAAIKLNAASERLALVARSDC